MEKSLRYELDRRLGWSQSESGRSGEEKKNYPYQDSNPGLSHRRTSLWPPSYRKSDFRVKSNVIRSKWFILPLSEGWAGEAWEPNNRILLRLSPPQWSVSRFYLTFHFHVPFFYFPRISTLKTAVRELHFSQWNLLQSPWNLVDPKYKNHIGINYTERSCVSVYLFLVAAFCPFWREQNVTSVRCLCSWSISSTFTKFGTNVLQLLIVLFAAKWSPEIGE
jgi:hypothetical protein